MVREFATDDHGAVTVDWVVLTAAVVGLGLGAITAVRQGTGDLSADISASLTGASVANLIAMNGERPDIVPDTYIAFSDNYLRLLYARWSDTDWAARNGRSNADVVLARIEAEIAYRGIDPAAPDGATTCGNLQALTCWNDATPG